MKTTALHRHARGFTLVEAIVVIVITGILAAVVAIFIAKPMEGYADASRRADMTDTADTALRRIGRDLRLALPNSVRTNGATAIEFLSTRTGGRYRAAPGVGGEDMLEFNQDDATSAFDILGPAIPFAATTLLNQNQIVIYNLGFDTVDAYSGNNRRLYSGVPGDQTTIPFTPAPNARFPEESPSRRFQIVDTPVSYRCDNGTLRRYWGYPIQAAPPPLAWLQANAASAILAQDVGGCAFNYAPGVTERSGMVSLQLTLQRNNDAITLYHQVHVSNVP